MDFERRILPFYMTYSGNYNAKQDETVLRDLDYLYQTYPSEVKKYQQRVGEILDKMDYEGSMIYDEYPDQCSLQHTAKSIVTVLVQEEERETEEMILPQKKEWLEHLIQVLLCNEIYRRRHGGRRRFIKF